MNENRLIVPAPTKPYEIAQKYLDEHHTDPRGRLLLFHRGLFYSWDGTHWPEGESRGRDVRSDLYRWLGKASYKKREPNGITRLTSFDPSSRKVSDVVDALQAAALISETIEAPAWLNGATPYGEVVAMQNGLLRLSPRELIPHTPAFFNEYVLPFDYDVHAPRPRRWHQFLSELWDGDEDSISTLAEIMGYIIAGGTAQQKMFLLVGPKRGGKGTIMRVLTALLGQENVASPTLSSLSGTFGLQPLVGKPLAAISDARLGMRSDSTIAVERLLSISGEDSITIDRKYKDAWTGRLPTRFVLLTNELPRLADASGTIASRFIILVLSESFYGREDPRLTDRLLAEAPGILNWALEGLDRLNERGHFVQPATSEAALRQIEDLASRVAAFVRDRCRVAPDAMVNKDELWSEWKQWCETEGAKPGTKEVLVRDLRAAFPGIQPGRKRAGGGVREKVLLGVALEVARTIETTPAQADA